MIFTDPEEFHDPIDEDERAKGNGDWRKMAMGKDGFFKRAIRTIRKTLAAENKAGQIGSVIKNIISPFIPSWLVRTTDGIGDSLKTDKTMIKSKNPKTTLAGIVLIIAGIAQFLGVESLSWDFASIINTALPILTGAGLLAARDGESDA